MANPPEGSPEWAAQDKGPYTIAICWAVTAFSTLFVIARLYVRGKIMGKLQSDDWFTVAAQICSWISTAFSTMAVASGNGKHFSLLSTEQKTGAILWTTVAFCPGVLSFGLPKMAVVVLLQRLLNPQRYHRWFLWWMGIWCQLTLFATVGVLLGRCMPARALWDFSVEGKCFDPNILVGYCIYAGSFSAFVDLYLAIYPTVVLFQLQLSLRKKIALCVALGIGSISGVVAIYKTTRIPSLKSPDFSYDTADLVIWTVIEGSTIIVACSIPILQPLMDLIMRRNPFSSNKSTKRTPRYFEDYSTGSKAGYELGQRKPKSKLRDELGLTIVKDDSQEDILSGNENNHHNQIGPGDSTGRLTKPVDGVIVRTDVVTVRYSQQHENQPSTERWGAV
ncbi:hypothetical protein SAPIO_CDS4726 [Scedosporium apiospermum]|uniref:Rhodopsin domain-containing protein n=1 Tax=Pseudallescheria apiosperma TaxID=563466 RepID=A0A084G7H3_PSEDA|nr:uncharacterized protein SAPIO_CDS4726 [Scedosporium apiospermum]KEZ43285.1 hypothetical protein SAPIO_CDS4726 [Scedosporium apiospermum]